MAIVCAGSIAFDYLMEFPGKFRDNIMPGHLENISLSFLVDNMTKLRGGVAPNIAYTLARLGSRPIVLGTVGTDAGEYIDWLDQQGVDTRFMRVIPNLFTASFFANTDIENNQICSFYAGAMAEARHLELSEMPRSALDLIVVSPNDPKAMDNHIREAKALGIPVCYDPGQQVARSDPSELKYGIENADLFFSNEYEWELIQKHTGVQSDEIVKKVPIVVTTLGREGARITAGEEIIHIPVVMENKSVDPTGVGDAFRGGFLRGFELGLDLLSCGQMGSLAATYCLESKGPQGQDYSLEDFALRFNQTFTNPKVVPTLFSNRSMEKING
ncbi:MAG TPA: carbohydrate kinase family protein [Bellilinea sp.]|nr:carbohydrate kinase family protein [Bellilinea sp.]